jgi:POT family proton-dependent oligopeptide transporter
MKGHPKGLLVLALTNMGERFGYYTMIAILVLYMKAKFGLSSSSSSLIYAVFLALVYFLPYSEAPSASFRISRSCEFKNI